MLLPPRVIHGPFIPHRCLCLSALIFTQPQPRSCRIGMPGPWLGSQLLWGVFQATGRNVTINGRGRSSHNKNSSTNQLTCERSGGWLVEVVSQRALLFLISSEVIFRLDLALACLSTAFERLPIFSFAFRQRHLAFRHYLSSQKIGGLLS